MVKLLRGKINENGGLVDYGQEKRHNHALRMFFLLLQNRDFQFRTKFSFFLLPYLFYGFNNDAVQISNVQLVNPKWLLPIFPTTMPFRTDLQLE